MNEMINSCVTALNSIGHGFCDYTAGIFIQSSVLIILLLLIDFLLRKRVRAVFRYCLWMLVFVKLILPPALSLPTGIGYWYGDYLTADLAVLKQVSNVVRPESAGPRAPEDFTLSAEIPQDQPSRIHLENAAPVISAVTGLNPITWQAVVFGLWLVGVLVISVLLIQRMSFVKGLIAQSEPSDERLEEMISRCQRQLGVCRNIELRLSNNISGPAVCGLFKPTILMPTTLLEKLSPDKLRAVLIHELVHIKRADVWVNLMQTVLQIIYFYNPFVWLANTVVRRIREQAVDEMVLVALGAGAKSYSNTLIDIAETAFWRTSLSLRLIGVVESKQALHRRIKHMLNRPIPKSSKVGVLGTIVIIISAAVFLPMAKAKTDKPQDIDAQGLGSTGYGILILDNSDPKYNGKEQYDDRLYLLDSGGNVEGAFSGFNICETMGGAHMLVVDEKRKTLWVAENVGGRLWHFDLKTGMLLQRIPDLEASALAIDPDTGNIWVMLSEGAIGKGHIKVVSKSGETEAEYNIPGFDIAYSKRDNSFWVVGKNIYKVDIKGKILGQITGQIPFTAVSVSVDQKTGNAWIVLRAHPQIVDSKPEVWIVGEDVQIQKRMNIGDLIPFCVAVDSDNGIVWVGCLGTTLHFTTAGEGLKSARLVSGFSVLPGASPNSLIAASMFGLIMASVGDTGYVEMGPPPNEVREQFSSSQKWVAMVPFAGAKLQSSTELAYLMNYKIWEKQLTKHPNPNSVAKLKALGKAVLMFANDYDDKYPDVLQGLRGFIKDDTLTWCEENVTYLGRGMTTADPPNIAIAYDRTLLEKGDGTLVLYNDFHVAFESSKQLEKLGIKPLRVEDNESLPSQFVATLPNGVTVELLGLCEYPSEGKKWWRPDGTELSKDILVRTRGRVSASGIPYTVAVKVTMPEDATFERGRIKGATGGMTLDAVDSEGRPISNMQAWMVYIDEKLTETSIQLGVATGAWKTRARDSSRGGLSTAGIVFSKAYESDEGVRIIVADEHLDLDYRITAIDTQGKEHLYHQRGGSAGRVRQTTAHFRGLKLNQIECFLFQTRPYEWVEFRNVSLQPGVKTDVQVKVESEGYELQIKEIFLPDEDRASIALDLAGGKLVQVTDVNSANIVSTMEELGVDLVYAANDKGDSRGLVFLRGATTDKQLMRLEGVPFPVYEIAKELPDNLIVQTAKSNRFKVTILSADKDKCHLRYYLLPDETDVQVEGEESREKVSRVIGADLPKSAKDIKFYSEAFMGGVDIGLMKFDIPLQDLKILLRQSDKLPDFTDLKTDPAIKNRMEKYKNQKVEWWNLSELKNTLYGEWQKTENLSQEPNKNVFAYKTLQICCGEIRDDLMSVYISCYGEINAFPIQKPAGQIQGEDSAGKQLSREQQERLERLRANRQSLSYKNMQKLGLSVAVFANDNKGMCPSNLSDLRKYIADEQIFDWINKNVVYLGKNQQYGVPPDAVLAYDELMLKKPGQETNVLYNDAHVALVSSKWLKEVGIRLDQ